MAQYSLKKKWMAQYNMNWYIRSYMRSISWFSLLLESVSASILWMVLDWYIASKWNIISIWSIGSKTYRWTLVILIKAQVWYILSFIATFCPLSGCKSNYEWPDISFTKFCFSITTSCSNATTSTKYSFSWTCSTKPTCTKTAIASSPKRGFVTANKSSIFYGFSAGIFRICMLL